MSWPLTTTRAVALWNEVCVPPLPAVRIVTTMRRKAFVARQNQIPEYRTEEAFLDLLVREVMQSDFLLGKNDRGWKASFDFICRETSAARLVEGRYRNRKIPGAWRQTDSYIPDLAPLDEVGYLDSFRHSPENGHRADLQLPLDELFAEAGFRRRRLPRSMTPEEIECRREQLREQAARLRDDQGE